MNSNCILPIELQPTSKVVTELQSKNDVNENNVNDVVQSEILPNESEGTSSDPLCSSSGENNKFLEISGKSDEQLAQKLNDSQGKEIDEALADLMLKGINFWKSDENSYSPEETNIIRKVAALISNANHLSLPNDEMCVLASSDFHSVISVIKKLNKKVGMAELGAMVLLAIAISSIFYLKKAGYRNEATFFKSNANRMGISPSCARDYATRGKVFLRHRVDILNGFDDVPGISLETFSNTCLAKLPLYEKAVDAFGSKQALIYLKELTFREFQKIIPSKKSERNPKEKKHPKESKQSDYDLFLQEFNLMPNEKGGLEL